MTTHFENQMKIFHLLVEAKRDEIDRYKALLQPQLDTLLKEKPDARER